MPVRQQTKSGWKFARSWRPRFLFARVKSAGCGSATRFAHQDRPICGKKRRQKRHLKNRNENHTMKNQSTRSRSLSVIAVAMAGLVHTLAAHADTVTDWSANLDQTIVAVAQPVPAQARSIAIVHAAIYDAVNGIARKYTPYFVTERAPHGARQEAAAAQAAYTTMLNLYPSQKAALDSMLA